MTKYAFLCEMRSLCARAGKALNECADSPLAEFYDAAEAGFFQRMTYLPAKEAEKTTSPSYEERIENFRKWVERQEEKAASHQRSL